MDNCRNLINCGTHNSLGDPALSSADEMNYPRLPSQSRNFEVWVALLVAGFLMGCSIRVSVTDPLLGESRAPQLRVPFFADSSDQCGPAALASVLVYWGSFAPPEALREEIYLRSIRGSLGLDLLLG